MVTLRFFFAMSIGKTTYILCIFKHGYSLLKVRELQFDLRQNTCISNGL
jgi:hypothetical protein